MIGLALLLGAALAGTAGSAGMAGEPESFGVSAVAGLPETVTLEQVLQLLREKSPRSAAERALVEVARAGVVAAGVLPNPSFDYGWNHLVSGTNTGSATVNHLAADQPLLLFGQRRQRRRSAELGVRLAESRFAESYAERAREARERFTSLLARQEKQQLLEESSEDLRRVARVVEKRAEAGDRSRYDALRIEVEAREVQTALADARADVEDASGRLAALLGFPEWRPRAVGELRPAAPGDPNYIDTADIEGLWSRAQQLRPALVAAKRSEAAARADLDLARRESLPVPVLSAGAALGQDAGNTTAVAGLSFPLPLFDRGQGPIARARAQQHAAELELQALREESHAELQRSVAVLERRREAMAELEKQVMERLPEMRRMAEDAYREGQGGILELLDALRSLTSVRQIHLDDLEAVKLAEIDSLFLAGMIDTD